jgi:predicted AlkP superfamily phosphohydrolase/phosphomutase
VNQITVSKKGYIRVETSNSHKVAVIGLDGIDLNFIHSLIERGYLLTIAKLIQGGVCGPLTSTIHPVSAPAWETFKTGKNPGKHGIYDFKTRAPGTYDRRLDTRQHPQNLWRLVSKAGRRVGVINVPRTYPPEQVNGYLVSGMLTPPTARDFTYPLALCKELEQVTGKYLIEPEVTYRDQSVHDYLEAIWALLRVEIQSAQYLFRQYPSDLFVKVFTFTDRMLHHVWKYIDPNNACYSQKVYDQVVELFQQLDEFLAGMWQELDDNWTLVIMSDHGFGPMNQIMYVNNWLAQQGYIQFKENARSKVRLLMHHLGIDIHSIYSLAKELSLDKILARLPQSLQAAYVRTATLTFDDVDWSRTIAYSFGNFGRIFINLRGREPMGCVEPGVQYEDVRAQIIADLHQLYEDDIPLVTGVWKREDIYYGPYLEQAPDIIFTLKDWEYGTAPNYEFASNRIFSAPLDNISANHRSSGMLIAWGSEILSGAQLAGAHIMDVAPTILHLMGLPIPSDQDGKVLTSIFKSGSSADRREITRSDVSPEQGTISSLSKADEQLISDRLEALGYV